MPLLRSHHPVPCKDRVTVMATVDVISASAGTGKTHRLSHILCDALLSEEPGQRVRPEGVVAVTYLRKAAAELRSRVRQSLMAAGAWENAERIRDGYVGTIHSVCQRLLGEFALEGGLSPELTPVEASVGERLFQEALAEVLAPDDAWMNHLGDQLNVDWRDEIQGVVRAARNNGLDASALRASAEDSLAGLLALLPRPVGDARQKDAALLAEMERLLPTFEVDAGASDAAAKRAEALASALACGRARGGLVPWLAQLQVAKKLGGVKKLAALVGGLLGMIDDHPAHPRFHDELAGMVRGVFDLAARVLDVLDRRKRAARVVDYEDMLAGTLRLLEQDDVQAALTERLDLLLVDEFQDTSPLQLAVISRLAELAGRAVWVGDPKQAILGFQGSDPQLMAAATFHFLAGRQPEILAHSYRSRPGLVDFCSEVFVRGLSPHGIPAEQVRLVAGVNDPPRLEETALLECWSFRPQQVVDGNGVSVKTRAADALAQGVAELLVEAPLVRERPAAGEKDWTVRSLRRGDVAVLSRTNSGCEEIAASLQARGIPAQVGLSGLTDTPEGLLLRAGLALLTDPQDGVASMEITWLAGAAMEDPDRWLAGRIAEMAAWERAQAILPDGEEVSERAPLPFHNDARVRAMREAQREAGRLSPSEAAEVVMQVLDLPGICRGWPEPARRLANLEALLATVREYEKLCLVERLACTVAGLVDHLRLLGREGRAEADRQAQPSDPDAVQVLTWHSAKGLEWPVVVLDGLGSPQRDDVLGLHVEQGPEGYVPGRPLAGRWLRWWPYPYGTQKNDILLRDSASGSEAAIQIRARERQERARLLYVGFTRPRDRLVLFAQMGKDGALTEWLDELADTEGRSVLQCPWEVSSGAAEIGVGGNGGRRFPCHVRHLVGLRDDREIERGSTRWFAGRKGIARPPEMMGPSRLEFGPEHAPQVQIGAAEQVGERMQLVLGGAAMGTLGTALHAFFAADLGSVRPVNERQVIAREILAVHGLAGAVDPDRLPRAADAVRAWVSTLFGTVSEWHTEWPLRWFRSVEGHLRLLSGEADLVLDTPAGLVVIDHKSFPGSAEQRDEHARRHAAQLAAYRTVLEAATGRPVVGMFLHFPIRGEVVEVVVERGRTGLHLDGDPRGERA